MYRQCSSVSAYAASRTFPYPKKSRDKTDSPQCCCSLGSVWERRLQQPQAIVKQPGMRRWTINGSFLYFCRRIMRAVQSVFQVNRRSCTWTVSSVGSQKAVDCLLYRTTSIKHFTFMLPCNVIDFFLNNQPDALIIQIYSVINSTCFGHLLCPSSGVFYCAFGTGKFHACF